MTDAGLYREIRAGAVRWRVDAEVADAFAAWLARPETARRRIQENRHRAVWRIDAVVPSGFVLKESRPLGLLRRLRALWPGRAVREWENAQILHGMGGVSPRPLAAGRAGRTGAAYLALERIPGETLDAYCAGPYAALSRPARNAFLARLGTFLKVLDDRLVESRDLHAGNVLVAETPPGRLYLVDLKDARVGRPRGMRRRRRQVARLLASLGALSPADRLRAARAYADAAGIPAARRGAFYRAVDADIRRLWRRRWRSRTRRCLADGGSFAVARNVRRTVYRRRDFPAVWVEEALAAFHAADGLPRGAALPGGAAVVKDAPASRVVRGLRGPWPGALCVKMYRPRGAARALVSVGRRARGLRAWVAANGLWVREAGISPPRAFVSRGWGPFRPEGYLIVDDLAADGSGRELDRRLFDLDWPSRSPAERRAWAEALGASLARAHQRGISIGDGKACNLFATGAPPRVAWTWVDVDGVAFRRRIGVPERIRFLTQLNASVPRFVSASDRLRVFRRYAVGLPRREARGILRAVARFSRAEKILYVGPSGDVEEEWHANARGSVRDEAPSARWPDPREGA